MVAWPHGHASATLRGDEWEGGEALCQHLGEGDEGGAGQAVELGALHRLSDGGGPEGPPCHSIPGYLEKNWETPRCVGGGPVRDASEGHAEVIHLVPHCRPPGRNRRAQGQDLSWLGAPRYTPDGGEVDHRAQEGRGTATWWPLHEDKGAHDGVAPHQTSQRTPPLAASSDVCPNTPPGMVPVDITDDVVSAVAGSL